MTTCPDTHKHGLTGTCYVSHKCRCGECRQGRAEYARQLTKRHAFGTFVDQYTDAEPVREHIHRLMRAGMGWKRIAEVSGVGNTAISQLIYGRKGSNKDPRKGEKLQRVLTVKAERIMQVRPTSLTLRDGALVPARGFRRRVEALMWVGWSKSKIARAIGVEPANLNTMMHRTHVTKKHFIALSRFYQEHKFQGPPLNTWRDRQSASRARNYACMNGFAPVIAWNDIDRDQAPMFQPEVAA